ncbi:MAG: trimethylamine methyltransferase family protein, partial [bacterium]
MNKAQARITVLTEEQIERVHAYTLHVLSTTGIRVDSERARGIFSKAIGSSSDGDRIRIPAELVEQALKSAPSSIEVFDRSGATTFYLGGAQNSETHFGIGVTNLWYQNPETDEVMPFSRKHLEISTRLGETLNSFEVVSTPGVIQDISSEQAEVVAALEMIANTTKSLVMLISNTQQFETALKLLQHLHGDLAARPFVIPYFNPVTPLALNKDTSDKMLLTIEQGLPFIYSSYGMSGATAPITAGGTLVMLNAELLAGLVFTQLVKEGAPVILGSLPSVFEMKNMISAYTPQTMLLNLACAEMMAHYGIPHSGTSGSGSGWGPDLLASGTLWMNHLTSCLGKVGLAPFVGGNFDSLAFSPATVIYSDEIIRQARLFSQGFTLDDASVGLDEIDSIGPGGNFLMSEQTLALYREIHEQHSHIWPGWSLDKWQAEKSPKAIDLLRKRALDVLANLRAPKDHDELI